MDPRAKLIFLMGVIFADLFFLDPLYLFAVFLTTVPFWIMAKVKMRALLPQLTGIGIFVLGLMFFVFSFSGAVAVAGQAHAESGVVISLGPLVMTLSGYRIGLVQIFRMAIPMITGLLVFSTTDPVMFARGMLKLRIPFEISFIFLVGLRFFPLVLEESANIGEAERVRGVGGRGPLARINATRLMIFPLFINSLRKSRDMGLSVESKAFGARKWKSFLRDVRFGTNDYLIVVWTIILLSTAAYVRYGLHLGWGWIF